jgi:hypothetical protein
LPTRTPCFGGFSFADSLTREHSSWSIQYTENIEIQ